MEALSPLVCFVVASLQLWSSHFQCVSGAKVVLGNEGLTLNLKSGMDFSVACKQNQTGHWLTKFSINNASPKLPKKWKVDIKHSVANSDGLEFFHLEGMLSAPPSKPEDYVHYPGIGYYKVHKSHENFDDAVIICSKEGGHLGIINSPEEAEVYKLLLKKEGLKNVFIGFHDKITEGTFITIFGEPLNSTGFHEWNPGQPDDNLGNEDCGCFRGEGQLCDVPCDAGRPFICEYDISWDF